MRMGPGKHLKGRTLMGGAVKPEEVSLTITRAPIILLINYYLVCSSITSMK